MADRPSPDSEQRSASYSPPPNHRPGWIGDGWGSNGGDPARPGVRGGWAGSQPAGSERTPTPVETAPSRTGTGATGGFVGLLTVSVLAAALASAGTYGILAASGQLDGQRAAST